MHLERQRSASLARGDGRRQPLDAVVEGGFDLLKGFTQGLRKPRHERIRTAVLQRYDGCKGTLPEHLDAHSLAALGIGGPAENDV